MVAHRLTARLTGGGATQPEAAMHQASILFTAAVMAMAGAWYVMQDITRNDPPAAAAQQHAAMIPAGEPLVD